MHVFISQLHTHELVISCMHLCISPHTHIDLNVFHVCIYASVWTVYYIDVCVLVYMCMCVYVCVCVCVLPRVHVPRSTSL